MPSPIDKICADTARRLGLQIIIDHPHFNDTVQSALQNIKKLKLGASARSQFNEIQFNEIAACLVVREFFKLAPGVFYSKEITAAVAKKENDKIRAKVAAAIQKCAAPENAKKITPTILDLRKWTIDLPGASDDEPYICLRYLMAALRAQEEGYQRAKRTVADLLIEIYHHPR